MWVIREMFFAGVFLFSLNVFPSVTSVLPFHEASFVKQPEAYHRVVIQVKRRHALYGDLEWASKPVMWFFEVDQCRYAWIDFFACLCDSKKEVYLGYREAEALASSASASLCRPLTCVYRHLSVARKPGDSHRIFRGAALTIGDAWGRGLPFYGC